MCVGVNLESLNLRKRVATSKAWGQKTQNINFVAIFCHEVAGNLFNARLVQLAFLFLTPSFQASDLGCQPFLGDGVSECPIIVHNLFPKILCLVAMV